MADQKGKTKIIHGVLVLCSAWCMLSCGQRKVAPENETTFSEGSIASFPLPDGFMGRSKPNNYVVYSDSVQMHEHRRVSTIKSVKPEPKQFATILTNVLPEKSIGKRVRYTAMVRSEGVKGWSGLWMRVDPQEPYRKRWLAFDNMHDRPITGTTSWTKYEIVLDIPEGSADIVYGILLHGEGQVWIDSTDVQIVGNDVPTTGYFSRVRKL